jgi:hypothetical protein
MSGVLRKILRFSPRDLLPQASAAAASADLYRCLRDGKCVPTGCDLWQCLDAMDVHSGANPAGPGDPQRPRARRRSGPQSIEVVAMPVPADPDAFKAYEDAGADRAVMVLMPATENEMLHELAQIAQQVLP